MADPILAEIWRVRELLVKKHGRIEGYWNYLEKLQSCRVIEAITESFDISFASAIAAIPPPIPP